MEDVRQFLEDAIKEKQGELRKLRRALDALGGPEEKEESNGKHKRKKRKSPRPIEKQAEDIHNLMRQMRNTRFSATSLSKDYSYSWNSAQRALALLLQQAKVDKVSSNEYVYRDTTTHVGVGVQ